MQCAFTGVSVIRLIGYLDSPFVRRVAVTARFLGVPYAHEELSIFRDYDEFREINPLVKVPTVIFEDGRLMVDSTLIIDHLEFVTGKSLLPQDIDARIDAQRIIGTALVAGEKGAQLIYETRQRPPELHHTPWIERLNEQMRSAVDLLEEAVGTGAEWLFGTDLGQADITTAVVWRFLQHAQADRIPGGRYPGLTHFSARAEKLPQFTDCPLS
jgi:glutathione S-transferase